MCVCFKRLRALNLLDPAAGAGAYRSASRWLTAAREWKRVYIYIEKSSLSFFFCTGSIQNEQQQQDPLLLLLRDVDTRRTQWNGKLRIII